MTGIKRPVAVTGGAFVLALAAAATLGIRWTIAGVVLAAMAAVVLWRVGKRRNAAILGLLLFALTAASMVQTIDQMGTRAIERQYGGSHAAVRGFVTQIETSGNDCLITARVRGVTGSGSKFNVTFYTSEELAVGDGFVLIGDFADASDPYAAEFSMRVYSATLSGINPKERSLHAMADSLRRHLTGTLARWLPGEEGAVAIAMATGDVGALPIALRTDFNRAGVSHILVVSGMHITLIIGLVIALCDRLRAGPATGFAALLATVIASILFYGTSASVLRSCFMAVFSFSGRMIQRRNDPVTSMAVSAAAILLISPQAVASASFQLSFGCCFAMTVVYPAVEAVIRRRFRGQQFAVRLLRTILLPLAMSATISLITFPILILFGMPVSLVSPFANLVVVPLVPLLLIPAFLAGIPFEWAGGLFSLITGLSARILIAASRFFASFALASVSTGAGYLKIFLIYAALAVLLYLFSKKKLRTQILGLCMALVLLIGILSRLAFTAGVAVITLYRDNAVLVSDNNRTALIAYNLHVRGVDYLLADCANRLIDDIEVVIIAGEIDDDVAAQLQARLPDAAIQTMTVRPGGRPVNGWFEADPAGTGFVVRIAGVAIGFGSESDSIRLADCDAAALYCDAGGYTYDYYLIQQDGKPVKTFSVNGSICFYIGEDGDIKTVVE